MMPKTLPGWLSPSGRQEASHSINMNNLFRGGFSAIPPVTKNLIIINALIWLVEAIAPQFAINGIIRHCGLHYVGASHFNPAQIITYMFVHDQATFFHVFFNMLTLFFFGPALERIWGTRRFLFYYMACGVGAALIQEGVWALTWQREYIDGIAGLNHVMKAEAAEYVREGLAAGNASLTAAMDAYRNSMVTVGASGAIFGLLLGFAFIFPNIPMYLFFIPVPIKAKYMVAGYAVIEFFFGVTGSMGTVAHFAHLGGMIFGLVLLLYWKKKGTLFGGNHYGW